MDIDQQPGKVANPARGQLTRENDFSVSPFAPENLVSQERFARVSLIILHTQSVCVSHILS